MTQEQNSEKIAKLISKVSSETDTPEEEVEEKVEEKFEMLLESQQSEIPEERVKFFAVKSVNNELKNMTGSSFSGGQAEELPVLTLGYQEKDGDYFVTEDGYKAIVGLGVVNPADDPAGLSTILIDGGDGVDIEYAKELFEPLKTLRGNFTRRQVGSRDGENSLRKGGLPTYVCQSVGDTTLEEVDPEEEPEGSRFKELPSDWEAKRDMINENIIDDDELLDLTNYSEHISDHTQSNDGRSFETAFGIDVKRIKGQIVDVFNTDDFGVMTVLDDTVFDSSEVPEELQTDQMRVAGLQVFDMAPDLLQYDEDSRVDVYGYVEQTDKGQYRMRGFGMIPIMGIPRDPHSDSNGKTEDDVEEEVI